jgi:putative Mg2+ transporter-C (MgtC) family protein
MDWIEPWIGNVFETGLRREWAGAICIVASSICGAVIGLERERRDKPAGLRTVVLIALGSTIFTMVSLLLAERKPMADPARLAAQIIPGIGFLGAGAIMRARGTVVGMTTGATIWAVAAVGVTIGSGYVAAGFFFAAMIIITLIWLTRLDWIVMGHCRQHRIAVTFRPDHGKSRPQLQEILDRGRVPDADVTLDEPEAEEHRLEAWICQRHRDHRVVISELSQHPQVVSIAISANPRS